MPKLPKMQNSPARGGGAEIVEMPKSVSELLPGAVFGIAAYGFFESPGTVSAPSDGSLASVMTRRSSP
jgi:hypothetical protein